VPLHVYAAAPKGYTLGFKLQPLFNARIAAQFDLPTSAEDSLPGQAERLS